MARPSIRYLQDIHGGAAMLKVRRFRILTRLLMLVTSLRLDIGLCLSHVLNSELSSTDILEMIVLLCLYWPSASLATVPNHLMRLSAG